MLKMSSNLCQADLHTPGNDITMSLVIAFLSPVTAEDPGSLGARVLGSQIPGPRFPVPGPRVPGSPVPGPRSRVPGSRSRVPGSPGPRSRVPRVQVHGL